MGLKTRRLIMATPGFWPIDYTVDDEETRNSGTEIYFLPLPNADTFN
jgi:hypothetical protein